MLGFDWFFKPNVVYSAYLYTFPGNCDSQFTFLSNGVCALCSASADTFQGSITYCDQRGAKLGSINDAADEAFVNPHG